MIIYKGRGYVYGIEYHLVFCVKYRKKIFYDNIKNSLFQIFSLIADEMDFTIMEVNTDLDHEVFTTKNDELNQELIQLEENKNEILNSKIY